MIRWFPIPFALIAALIANAQSGKPAKAPASAPPAAETPVDESQLADYTHLYPKSTPEEYALAAEATRLGCNEYRQSQIRISPKVRGPKENPLETCKCLIRNLAPARDIHEMRVLNAMFRNHEPPASVFQNDETLSDVFDERPDYRDHATRTIEKCKMDKNYDVEKDPGDDLGEAFDYVEILPTRESSRPVKSE